MDGCSDEKNWTISRALRQFNRCHPREKEELKERTRREGGKYIERPSKGVFSIKPDKYKVRIVACGNKTHEVYGKISTSDLDAAMLRFLLSWSASSSNNCLASLDVTAAFLNAALPEGRVVVLRPPTILYKLQLISPGHVWLVKKAIYGLREAPNLWSEERTEMLSKLTFSSEGELYAVVLSEIRKSLCLLVKKRCLLKRPKTDQFSLTSKSFASRRDCNVWHLCRRFFDNRPPKTGAGFHGYSTTTLENK